MWGGQEVHHNNMVCVAMRGRNPEHPTDRTLGIHTEQRLEMNKEGLVNTLTTVQKDNLCLEIKKVGQISNDGSQYGTVISDDGLCSTLTASSSENINYVETVYRIRKLTPKECGRLMGYCDFDIEKTLSVNSNSQVYRQFGNAIVKQVLMAIFLQLGIKGLKNWNDRTPEEREKLVMGSVYDKEFE
jgi:site-specific DNA-cytosine methylase